MSDRFTITVGGRTFVCSEGRVTTELNKPDRASGTVAADDLAERGADWAGSAHASIEGDDATHGRVIQAQSQEDGSVAVSRRGATMLDESLLPPMVVHQIDRREIVYLAAREAGIAPEDNNIHGLAEAVTFEPLWVLAPVRGLSVRREVKVGVVELVDGDAGREMLRRFVPPLDAQFSDPLAAALVARHDLRPARAVRRTRAGRPMAGPADADAPKPRRSPGTRSTPTGGRLVRAARISQAVGTPVRARIPLVRFNRAGICPALSVRTQGRRTAQHAHP